MHRLTLSPVWGNGAIKGEPSGARSCAWEVAYGSRLRAVNIFDDYRRLDRAEAERERADRKATERQAELAA